MFNTEKLKEFWSLHSNDILTESETIFQKNLCDSLNENDFRISMCDLLDADQELTKQILNYLNKTGNNIEQIVFGGVAIGKYLLNRLYPSDECNEDLFRSFWIDPCDYNEEITSIVNAAINRAIDKMIIRTGDDR